jgi:hypothetical protein
MGRLADDEYWQDRPVPHVAQGDLFEDLSGAIVVPTPPPSSVAGRGQRKRPQQPGGVSAGVPDDQAAVLLPPSSWGLICNYTCGFLAQPGNLRTYAHPYRLVAPVWPLRDLVHDQGLKAGDARRVVQSGGLHGLMYLPAPPGAAVDADDEWGTALVAMLFRVTTVRQDVLETRRRIARLGESAQRILITRMIQLVGPMFPDYNDPSVQPDMSDGWA